MNLNREVHAAETVRGRSTSRIVIGLDRDDVDHLRRLRPSEALGIWEHGYNEATDLWEPARAAAFAAARVADKRKDRMASGKKRKRCAAE